MPTTVRVTWNPNPPVEQVTKYDVLQSKDGGAFSSLGVVTGTQKDILNPLPGVYHYKVKAINLAGVSVESDAGSSPDVPTKPSTPTVVVIES